MKCPYLEKHELEQLEALLPHAIRDTMQGWKATRLRGGSASMAFYGNVSSVLLKAFDDLAAEIRAQPEQEPVSHVYFLDYPSGRPRVAWDNANNIKIGDKLYTTPPQRKPLTHPQIHELDWPDDVSFEDILPFVRAIEAAHGIKGEA